MVDTVVTSDVAVGAEALARGQLVAFPTETVYGLGADAARPSAVRAVFEAKGRPPGHPLIVHVHSAEAAMPLARLDAETESLVDRLAAAFWPGPLTIVVPRSPLVADETVGGRATVGLRVPDHPLALALIEAFGGGVAAPSANRFGRVSPTTAAHVLADLDGVVDVVLDGGPTAVGIESTIVELTGPVPTLLRPGAVTAEAIAAVVDGRLADGTEGESRAPGMLASHYAPDATVALTTLESLAGDLASALARSGRGRVGVIAPRPVDHRPSWCLPTRADDYANRLYATLRAADRAGVDHLLIVPPGRGPMMAAVLDRLTKAAGPR